jgi:hypothetical protein
MNRKAFLILIILLVVIGGAGLVLFWQDLGAWRGGDTKIGSRLLEKLPVNDVAQIRIIDAKGTATLALKDRHWVVRERADYSANFGDVNDLLTTKLPDLKVVQTENVGASLLPRLNLVEPVKDVKDAKDADNAGTRLELTDSAGKVIASMLLGKKVIKVEDSPLPIKQEKAVGRYVLYPGNAAVLVVSDGLTNVEARPERWLAKEFFKVERIKSLASSGPGGQWKIARSEEFEPWKFADGAGQLDPTVVSNATKALAGLTFTDVALDVKAENFDKPRTFVAETLDGVTYTLRAAKKPDSEDYYLAVAITGEPLRERKPEKGEKPQDKERLDKYFVDDMKRLNERLKVEQPSPPGRTWWLQKRWIRCSRTAPSSRALLKRKSSSRAASPAVSPFDC